MVEEGEIRSGDEGREFVVRPAFDAKIEDYLRPVFQQHYTMSFENYPVEVERVHGMQLAECRPAADHRHRGPSSRARRRRRQLTRPP